MISYQTIAAIRFGYGFHPNQTPPTEATALLQQLGNHASDLGGPGLHARARMLGTVRQARKAKDRDAVKAATRSIRSVFRDDAAARLTAPVVSPNGFQERLAWFWADHFTIAARNPHMQAVAGRFEPDTIRPHIAGRFADMLKAAVTHPAMLIYLDQWRSVGPNSAFGLKRDKGLNENLAREIIELHTLGVGADYKQSDIGGFARLLTGLSINKDTGATVFRHRATEPGTHKVLGRAYGPKNNMADILHCLDDLAAHPATALHIAQKLARHFVADIPPEDLVQHMTEAYVTSEGSLSVVYGAMLEHPDSWNTFGAKVKQPFDYVVSGLRAVGINRSALATKTGQKGVKRTTSMLKLMNQPIWGAPGPDGWPEAAEAWITPQGLTQRMNWAAGLARRTAKGQDPRVFLATALSDYAHPDTDFAVNAAAEAWEGIAFTLASPEFNRR
ncbi:MAG: DUF1800 domain-containing protein [Pikeienuella sp.]